MSTEAMKLALEALEHLQPTALTSFYTIGNRNKAITALQKALAQPQQEPVPTECRRDGRCQYAIDNGIEGLSLGFPQPAQQEQQEPVAGCVCRWNSEGDRVVTCDRHQGWLEVIAEWADRAREAEKKLKALTQRENGNESAYQRGYLDGMAKRPQPLTDEQVMDIVDVQRAKVAFDTARIGYKVARAIEAAHGIKENT